MSKNLDCQNKPEVKESEDKLYEKFKGSIFAIAYSYTKNKQDSEEITQETFIKIFKNINDLKEKDRVKAWIAKIAKTTAQEYLRKKKREEDKIESAGKEISKSSIEKAGKRDPEKNLLDKEFENELRKYEASTEIEKLKHNRQFLKELLWTLDYINAAYSLKRCYNENKEELDPLSKTRYSLLETKKLIEKNFGPSNKELHSSQKEFLNLSTEYLSELIREMDWEIEERLSSNWFLFPYRILLDNVDKLNIDPPVLIFMVWSKAFRKKKTTDLKAIKALLLEIKEKSKNSRWGSLFEPLDASFNEETWRKKINAHFKKKPFYADLASLIYKKCFIEKEAPGKFGLLSTQVWPGR
jgi:RNA polymerase sigma factor (sigma-70 family)